MERTEKYSHEAGVGAGAGAGETGAAPRATDGTMEVGGSNENGNDRNGASLLDGATERVLEETARLLSSDLAIWDDMEMKIQEAARRTGISLKEAVMTREGDVRNRHEMGAALHGQRAESEPVRQDVLADWRAARLGGPLENVASESRTSERAAQHSNATGISCFLKERVAIDGFAPRVAHHNLGDERTTGERESCSNVAAAGSLRGAPVTAVQPTVARADVDVPSFNSHTEFKSNGGSRDVGTSTVETRDSETQCSWQCETQGREAPDSDEDPPIRERMPFCGIGCDGNPNDGITRENDAADSESEMNALVIEDFLTSVPCVVEGDAPLEAGAPLPSQEDEGSARGPVDCTEAAAGCGRETPSCSADSNEDETSLAIASSVDELIMRSVQEILFEGMPGQQLPWERGSLDRNSVYGDDPPASGPDTRRISSHECLQEAKMTVAEGSDDGREDQQREVDNLAVPGTTDVEASEVETATAAETPVSATETDSRKVVVEDTTAALPSASVSADVGVVDDPPTPPDRKGASPASNDAKTLCEHHVYHHFTPLHVERDVDPMPSCGTTTSAVAAGGRMAHAEEAIHNDPILQALMSRLRELEERLQNL